MWYMGDIQVVPYISSCHDGLGLSVLIQSHITGYFCIPQKASVGMYSSCDISCLCTF